MYNSWLGLRFFLSFSDFADKIWDDLELSVWVLVFFFFQGVEDHGFSGKSGKRWNITYL